MYIRSLFIYFFTWLICTLIFVNVYELYCLKSKKYKIRRLARELSKLSHDELSMICLTHGLDINDFVKKGS